MFATTQSYPLWLRELGNPKGLIFTTRFLNLWFSSLTADHLPVSLLGKSNAGPGIFSFSIK